MARPVTPLLAADAIIELNGKIVLIERKNPPFGYAIPGGFVDLGETVEAAAVREAKEETNVDVEIVKLLGVYSDPARDPRGHTVSVIYVATGRGAPTAKDDAKEILLWDPSKPIPEMAFDHQQVLRDYLEYRATK